MDLSINFKNKEKNQIDTQIHTQKIRIFFYFKLSFSKFARDSQNTQTQSSSTQKV